MPFSHLSHADAQFFARAEFEQPVNKYETNFAKNAKKTIDKTQNLPYNEIENQTAKGVRPMVQSRINTYTTNIAVRITLEIYTCLERIGEIGDISDEVYP